jgi:undecaprenyl diphosphate synthase
MIRPLPTAALPPGPHVAVIMDGNGRWAVARGMPRTAGHRAGATAVRRVVDAAAARGVSVLTLYAFSADNWRRPQAEVGRLMALFRAALRRETAQCVRQGVRLTVIGRRDRLPAALVKAIGAAERETATGTRLHLRVAVDYSARESIVRAAGTGPLRSPEQFTAALATAQHEQVPAPPVDLLIRTGGEQRLSDFLLWECAYAELFFTPVLWPDFGTAELDGALDWFHRRERRFGAIQLPASA